MSALKRLPRIRVSLAFVPGDLWVGAYIKSERGVYHEANRVIHQRLWTLYLCLLPMLPIRFDWTTSKPGPIYRYHTNRTVG